MPQRRTFGEGLRDVPACHLILPEDIHHEDKNTNSAHCCVPLTGEKVELLIMRMGLIIICHVLSRHKDGSDFCRLVPSASKLGDTLRASGSLWELEQSHSTVNKLPPERMHSLSDENMLASLADRRVSSIVPSAVVSPTVPG